MSVLAAVGEGLGELTLGERLEDGRLAAGGDAANICVSASRMGTPARLVGRVGDDGLGRSLADFWEGAGVGLGHLRRDGMAPTGLYLNQRARGDHSFVYWRRGSAGARLAPEDLNDSLFEDLGALVITGVTLAVSESSAAAAHEAARLARERGVAVACVLNHRPALGSDPAALADLACSSEVVIGSVDDFRGVFGDRGYDPASLGGGRPGGPSEIAITDGAAAATVEATEARYVQPVPRVEVRSAAGAGDAFAGAYLATRLQGAPTAEALRWAVGAASLSVARDGCALSYPIRAEVAATLGALPDQASPQPVPSRA